MNEFEKNRILADAAKAPVTPEFTPAEPSLPKTYPGSGQNKNPVRMMKIEEVVEWDMEFGVKIGPIGYDHLLTCPYCRKRMLLVSHEGSRQQKNIRIVYLCENCAAHTVVQFSAPNQKIDLPDLDLGEKVVIEKPTPVPNLRSETTAAKPEPRSTDRSRRTRGGAAPTPRPPAAPAITPRPIKSEEPTSHNRPARGNRQESKRRTPPPSKRSNPSQIAKKPIVQLPGEQIKKLTPTPQSVTPPTPPTQPLQADRSSNAYFRSRRKPNTNSPKKPDSES